MKEKQNTPSKKTSEAELMAKLGISEKQVQVNPTTKKSVSLDTNADKLKDNLRTSVKSINAKEGKLVSFVAIKRDGKMKDANGTILKDENGKDLPRYTKQRIQGHFTIDKTEDGFFVATRGVQYTESHTIADFQELDDNTD